MSEALQATYWLGTLAVLIVSLALFLKIISAREEEDDARWREGRRQFIEASLN